jgi:type II secretory pathway component PulF
MSTADPSNAALPVTLSNAEAAELAAGVAELAKAGLPLPDGLRALAQEWPSRRLRGALTDLATRIERGESLEQALDGAGGRLPIHLRGVIRAGVRSGHLPEALEQFVELERTQHELRRQVWVNLAYPTLLIVMISVLAVLAAFYIMPQFAHIFRDFKTQLPVLTTLVLKCFRPIAFTFAFVAAVMLLIPLVLNSRVLRTWIAPAFYVFPFIGPPLRWTQLARFSRLMAMLLDEHVPLAESLRTAARGLEDGYLAGDCREAAAEVEQGRRLSEVLAERSRFSYDILPLLEVGEKTSSVASAFGSAAEMFEGRASTQTGNLEAVLLPTAFFAVLFFCGVIVIALFMPLIALITRLTGGFFYVGF